MGTAGHLFRSAPTHFKNLLSLQAFSQRNLESRADAFDSQHRGIDTAGIVELSNLRVHDEDWKFGHGYQAIHAQDFTQFIQTLSLDYSQFVFVDIGSGKGRALLLAAAYPFKAIVGVELAAELHTIAEKNIQAYPESQKVCLNITSVCRNALHFSFPNEPLVIFLYNPFIAQVLIQFVKDLIRSVTQQPRDVYLYYWNDEESKVFDAVGLRAIKAGYSAGESWSIYKIEPEGFGKPGKSVESQDQCSV